MKNNVFRFIDGAIYLLLIILGAYFGRFHGAIFLVSIYFFYVHYPKIKASYIDGTASGFSQNQTKKKLKKACEQLSVSPSCSLEELILARRRLLNQYHPDKLLNATPKQQQQAERKVNEINRAFQIIKTIKKL